ncbi:LPS biosynthesis rfbu related protein [Halarchaeum grantii]|uniref:LPS biosynthesis rfbu related protein n=1 Tax=Halarchaeum grantii TaxID=1193105 RepID=A0A830FAP6_9EURY|nr:glycosyltransferase family 4 protein [Halarchaeum grantii]GGL36227.1 LPS biosynthesis rfbu related protein [Halarchaeum grantii]
MKIIQTPARFPPSVGGVEQYTYILSKKLVERGHEVTVVCAKEPEDALSREIYEGIDVVRLDYTGKIAQTNLTQRLPVELYREIRDADIVHTHLPTPWTADVSVAIAKICGTPSVITYHNDIRGDGIASHVANIYNKTVMQATLAWTDRIITTQESYFENSNIPERLEDKTVTIRNGVDVERFQPQDVDDDTARELGFDTEKTNLFFLSVLDEYHDYKGLENLLEAMQHLPDKYHLVVGGDGSKRGYYEQKVTDLGVGGQVTFAGYIPDETLPRYYNVADMFVLPSTSSEQEGFGLVALEALSCGTPVITTDIVGVSSEIKTQDVGKIIPPDDVSSLTSAITAVSMSPKGSIEKRGRHICVSSYSWQTIADDLLDLFNEVRS